VRVTPKGGRDDTDGWSLDANGRPILKLRVRAAAADGAANRSVVALVAARLGVAPSAVRIAAGATSRVKRLEVAGRGEGDLAAAFGTPRGKSPA